MNILRSNDVKRINKIVIRKALLELRSATRKELMEATGISSSSIGSLITEMVHDEDILEESIDSSTGGRCPMRYVLNYHRHRVMCILINRIHADIQVVDCLDQEVEHDIIPLEDFTQMKKRILDLCEQYAVASINVSIPGIIKGNHILQDTPNGMKEITFLQELQESSALPFYIENDVKCMVQGYLKEYGTQENTICYLYLSQEGGLGCACVNEGHLIHGADHLAGEVGLLKYEGKTINNLLREHPNDDEKLKILTRLISILVCTINPNIIVLSGLDRSWEYRLNEALRQEVSSRFSLRFAFDDQPQHHILKALSAHAIEELLHEL